MDDVCRYCKRGAAEIERIAEESKKARPLGVQGYSEHGTSSLITMFVACIVEAQHGNLDVGRASKLSDLRKEIDLRIPIETRDVWDSLLKERKLRR